MASLAGCWNTELGESVNMDAFAISILPYLTTVIGFLIVYVLNGIKGEIKDVKVSVNSLEKDLRDGMSNLDRRVVKIEAGCSYMHGHQKDE
jgi:hypothetical protein